MTMKLNSMLGMAVLLGFCLCGPFSEEVIADRDNQADAEKLLREAEELTDIRATGGHPFRMAAHVKVFDERTQATEGTYSLVWKGPTDWQDKLQLGTFSQERTAVVDKLFISRNAASFTLEVSHLLKLLEFPGLLRFSPDAKAQKLHDRIRNGSHEREIDLAFPGRSAWKTIFLEESSATPKRVEYKGSHFGYRFEDYGPFDGHQFPHLLVEFDSHKPLIQIQVQELIDATTGDSTIAPSPNARWYQWCPHPKPMTSLDAGKVFPIPWPLTEETINRPVAIYGVEGTDGKWHNLTVVKSGGKEADGYWMDVMRQQRFSPASCGDVPVVHESVMKFP
jgi:hypothetical protein